jgi:hypothetical protein
MTAKKQLHHLVDRLGEDQAEDLLQLANLYLLPAERAHPLPAFVGMGDSGRSDASEQVDQILGEKLTARSPQDRSQAVYGFPRLEADHDRR